MSFDRLIQAVIDKNNPTVVGLDPKLSYLPRSLKQRALEQYGNTMQAAAQSLLWFNQAIIDAVHDIVPAVKPQSAYYEQYGFEGVRVLEQTIRYAQQKGLFVIVDGKRNDIGSTMEAYAAAYLGTTPLLDGTHQPAFDGDALTVNGYQAMGRMCEEWGKTQIGSYGYSAVGAVVGATYPQQLSELRAMLPHTFFLVPGYGAQGGGAGDVAGGFDVNGLGALINSSRGILCAYQKAGAEEQDFALAARQEAIRMRDELNRVRG